MNSLKKTIWTASMIFALSSLTACNNDTDGSTVPGTDHCNDSFIDDYNNVKDKSWSLDLATSSIAPDPQKIKSKLHQLTEACDNFTRHHGSRRCRAMVNYVETFASGEDFRKTCEDAKKAELEIANSSQPASAQSQSTDRPLRYQPSDGPNDNSNEDSAKKLKSSAPESAAPQETVPSQDSSTEAETQESLPEQP